jgi:hypothetical protein
MQLLQEAKVKAGQQLKSAEGISPCVDFTRREDTGGQQEGSTIRDYGLAMRRSFRVGWSRDGRLVHPGKAVFKAVQQGAESDQPKNDENAMEDEASQMMLADETKTNSNIEDADGKKYRSCHRVLIERPDSLRWFRSAEKELGGSTDSAADLDKLVAAPLRIFLDACELDPATVWLVDDDEDEPSSPQVNRMTGVAPLWRLPVASLEDLPRYSLFLVMLKGLTQHFSWSLTDRDHPDWPIAASASLFMACVGQEDHVIQALAARAKEARNVLSGKGDLTSLVALDFSDVLIGGVPLADSLLPLYEDTDDVPACLWERRREFISRWMQQLAESCTPPDLLRDPLASAATGNGADVHNAIFDLLCCRRTTEAVQLAQEAGMFRLATLLSQVDGDDSLVRAMRQQLQQWYLQDVDSTIPRELLDVYRLLGGEFVHHSIAAEDSRQIWEASLFAPSRRNAHFSWPQCIGALLWFGGSTDDLGEMCGLGSVGAEGKGKMGTALERYRAALDLQQMAESDKVTGRPAFTGQLVPEPEADFLLDDNEEGVGSTTSSSDGKAVNHGVFSLLELLLTAGNAEAETEQSVAQCVEALRGAGFTRDIMDHRAVYMVLAVLECVGFVAQGDQQATVVRQQFVGQLIALHMHPWALFVACQIEDDDVRTQTTRDLLMQWAASGGGGSDRDTDFLLHTLHLPASWVHEAAAYRAGYAGNCNEKAAALVRALLACEPAPDAGSAEQARADALCAEANKVICEEIAPTAILQSGSAVKRLAKLLALLQSETPRQSAWAERNSIFSDYLALRAKVDSLGAEGGGGGDGESCNAKVAARMVMEEAAVLLGRLSEHVDMEKKDRDEKTSENKMKNRESEMDAVQAGRVTLLDMGSYLLQLVVRLVEMEAQDRLREEQARLQEESISAAEKDRLFSEKARSSADSVVTQLRSLPTNCVFEGHRKRLERAIGLKLSELQD